MKIRTLVKLSTVVLFAGLLCVERAKALDIGQAAPTFSLENADGKKISLDDYETKTVVLEWFNDDCPFVKKHYEEGAMQELQKEYAKKGIVWLTITSTAPDHSNYLTPEKAKSVIKDWKIEDAQLLLDPKGTAGKLYGAKTTPHMFIIDKGKLVYQGAIDDAADTDSDPRKGKNFVKTALDELQASKPVTTTSTKSYGCSIKYAD